MQKTSYRKMVMSFLPFTKFAFVMLFSFIVISFTPDKAINSYSNTGEGEKDSTKGFRNLLGSSINTNNTVVLFELNPRVVSFVNDYLKKQSGDLEKMRLWGQPYFMIYDRILSAHSIPLELKYLSVVESNLQAGSSSFAGAVGPWQLMRDEAKRFGLKVTATYDERTNFYKSTEAAAKLLKELYKEYDDWLLVIAAYNCGKGGLNRAITKAKSRNFYELQMYLPEETRNHVKKYIATHYFFEGGGGWTTLTAKEVTEKKETIAYLQSRASDTASVANTVNFEVTGKYNSVVAANTLLMSVDQFNTFNPYFDKVLAEGKTYTLKLPQEKMDLFKSKRQQILYESVRLLLSATPAQNITTAVTVVK